MSYFKFASWSVFVLVRPYERGFIVKKDLAYGILKICLFLLYYLSFTLTFFLLFFLFWSISLLSFYFTFLLQTKDSRCWIDIFSSSKRNAFIIFLDLIQLRNYLDLRFNGRLSKWSSARLGSFVSKSLESVNPKLVLLVGW